RRRRGAWLHRSLRTLSAWQGSLAARPLVPAPSGRVFAQRQGDPEGRAAAGGALDFDPAAVGFDDLAGGGEGPAGAGVVGSGDGALELAEDAVDLGRGEADAAIADLDVDEVAVDVGRDLDRLAQAEGDGVGQEVEQDLLEPDGVPAADDGGDLDGDVG